MGILVARSIIDSLRRFGVNMKFLYKDDMLQVFNWDLIEVELFQSCGNFLWAQDIQALSYMCYVILGTLGACSKVCKVNQDQLPYVDPEYSIYGALKYGKNAFNPE